MWKSVLLIALLAQANCPCLAEANSDKSSAADALDNQFISMYSQARSKWRQQQNPVVIYMGGKLILLLNGQREEHPVLSPVWQTLKTVDHVPLATFVQLESVCDTRLDDATRQALSLLVEKTQAARPEILAGVSSGAQADRQMQLLDGSTEFIKNVLAKGTVTKGQLDEFASKMGKLALLNADDAEVLELSEVDRLIQGWKQRMTASQWALLKAIVCDGHMPRQQERIMQYFFALLKQKREGRRVIFSENGDDESKVLDLLATHGLDEEVAVSFFHDPSRMHRDLLGDGAKHYLAKHPPDSGPPKSK